MYCLAAMNRRENNKRVISNLTLVLCSSLLVATLNVPKSKGLSF